MFPDARAYASQLDQAMSAADSECQEPVGIMPMRIADNQPDRLTLEARPWVLGCILAAVIVLFCAIALATIGQDLWLGLGMLFGAGMFGICFVVFVRRVIVIFDRPAGAVVIRTATLMGQTERTMALPDIRHVRVETSISRSSGSGGSRRRISRTHRPVLVTAAGPVPLTEIYSGGNGAAEVADAVNRWLGVAAPQD